MFKFHLSFTCGRSELSSWCKVSCVHIYFQMLKLYFIVSIGLVDTECLTFTSYLPMEGPICMACAIVEEVSVSDFEEG